LQLTFEQSPTSSLPRRRVLSSGPGKGQTTIFFDTFNLAGYLCDSSGNSFKDSHWHFEISDGNSYNDFVESEGGIGLVTFDSENSSRYSQFKSFVSFVLPHDHFSDVAESLLAGQKIKQIRLDLTKLKIDQNGHLCWHTADDLMISLAILEIGE
jgi:hypothetical protein